jgi:hypothetical protein
MKDAKYNLETKKGTYSDKIHHGEVKIHYKFMSEKTTRENQLLASSLGIQGAKKILFNEKKD